MNEFLERLEPTMTPQQLLGIAIRLLAIWLAFSGIQYLASLPAFWKSGVSDDASIIYGVSAIYFVCALLLWFFPMWAAHKLLPRTNFENKMSFDPYEIGRVGAALIGLWLLTRAIPSLVWVVISAYLMAGNQSVFSALTADTKMGFAVAMVEAILALLIIFNAGAFARIVVGRKDGAPVSSE
jgi:hypothetical protein